MNVHCNTNHKQYNLRTIAVQTFLENFYFVVLEVRKEVRLRILCSKVNVYQPLMLLLLSKAL